MGRSNFSFLRQPCAEQTSAGCVAFNAMSLFDDRWAEEAAVPEVRADATLGCRKVLCKWRPPMIGAVQRI